MAVVCEQEVDLAQRTTLGVGGRAARVFTAATEADVVALLERFPIPPFVLGGGSNLVVDDARHEQPFVIFGDATLEIDSSAEDSDDVVRVWAAAGAAWDALVGAVVDHGLCGVECLAGIPGTVGAAPIQNIGAYGQQLSDVCELVRVYDRQARAVRELVAAECGFGYRASVFKRDPTRFVVLGIRLALRRGAPAPPQYAELAAALSGADADVATVRAAVLALRRKKSMLVDVVDPDSRSAGSFFTNPEVAQSDAERLEEECRRRGLIAPRSALPRFAGAAGRVKLAAAWLIEQAGFQRGYDAGPVGLSTKHALAIVNRGGATARQVIAFAERLQRAVNETFGIRLQPEPVFVGQELPALWRAPGS